MTISCPTRHDLEEYLLGQSGADEAAGIKQHLASCSECLTILQELEGETSPALPQPKSEPGSASHSGLPTEPSLATVPPRRSPAEGTSLLFPFLSSAQQPDEIGRLGHYRVLETLGAGGMGMVFVAEDSWLRRRVALKVMKPALASESSNRERFLQEARSAAAIEHEHIVAIYQVAEENGLPYLAMPLLKGETLEDRLRREPGGRLPLGDVLRIGREIASGLAAAHKRSLVHRDIKPANIFLPESGEASVGSSARSGRTKLLDFGLARALDSASHLTQQGVVLGTPAYMSPEQAGGRPVDARADLFSLGSVLYRMSTGRLPFIGSDTISTLMAVATEDPPALRQLNPELPVAFSYLVMKLLAKKPEDRVSSAAEVVEALEAIERGRSPVIAAGRKRPSRWLMTTAVIGGIALVAGLAAVWTIVANKGTPEIRGGVVRAENTVMDVERKLPAPLTVPVSPAPKALVTIARFGDDRGHVRCAQAAPDGKRILTGGMDRKLRLWDLASQRLIQTMKEESAEVISAVAFTPDGQKILTCRGAIQKDGRPIPGKDHRLSLWDAATGKLIKRLPGSPEDVWTIAIAPDGRSAVSGGLEHRIRRWDLAEGTNTGSLMTRDERAWCLTYSPDGRCLFSAGTGGMIHQWDTSTWQEVRALHGHTALVRCLAISPDGQWLASGGLDQSVRLWKTADGKMVGKLEGSESGIVSVAWSPGSDRVLTLSGIEARPQGGWEFARRDYVMRLYDSRSQKLRGFYNLPGGAVPVDLSFLSDGQAVLVRGDGSIQLFELPR